MLSYGISEEIGLSPVQLKIKFVSDVFHSLVVGGVEFEQISQNIDAMLAKIDGRTV